MVLFALIKKRNVTCRNIGICTTYQREEVRLLAGKAAWVAHAARVTQVQIQMRRAAAAPAMCKGAY
jgi:hypothetical protein